MHTNNKNPLHSLIISTESHCFIQFEGQTTIGLDCANFILFFLLSLLDKFPMFGLNIGKFLIKPEILPSIEAKIIYSLKKAHIVTFMSSQICG